ncbi:uncharacterized protein LOC109849913 [Asparagus officinalis]|uniref:uncharacterized protein LOC109849913 n=1 Tax=Asparagus officinalis TaxID=4686 RepID=UPI00098E7422|nr:uncharacterized protein LOC109849913 [Asparagus officinalis]
MLLRQSPPAIRKLPDPIRSMVAGWASPLERNPQSPKGWKNRESDGIGLGVVLVTRPNKVRCAPEPISIGSYGRAYQFGRRRSACDENGAEKDRGLFYRSSKATAGDILGGFRPAEFLNFCYLCRKKLHGKDIYMYRGEKAFCSVECRCQQIASDEFHEKCRSEALRACDASRSSCTDDHRLFFTAISIA